MAAVMWRLPGRRDGVPGRPAFRTALVFVAVLFVLASCRSAAAGAPAAGAEPASAGAGAAAGAGSSVTERIPLVVLGAASLTTALAVVVPAYEAAHPGVSLRVSTGASSALRVQVEQGAPADVFLSADTVNAQALVDERLSSGAAVPFAGNELTVIVPLANPARITSPAGLAAPGVRVVAAGPSVPITKYANLVVANLARQPGYPADFAARYAANVVSQEQDVRAVVAKIEVGEGDGAIVYTTDARASTLVRAVAIPAAANVPATYAGVVVRSSAHVAAATAFLAWLAGPAGRAILGRFGFLAP
jgi:molybdate transport system substrate-binding protein